MRRSARVKAMAAWDGHRLEDQGAESYDRALRDVRGSKTVIYYMKLNAQRYSTKEIFARLDERPLEPTLHDA